ncbi:hypothetical protein [Thalassospira povalilytica]|uniref:Uncharacterized protein n=1 Tax=Thalassospira povalilytica TaxID=732237 RepID=A0A8I1M597_9PROT|nr:hypothetical protein [Thalassospira povalilytica]MBN8195523.1 hypothetical protein [Thalassospira povalilytica]
MSLDDFRGLAYKIQMAASEYERERIIKDYRDEFLEERKSQIIEEMVEDIKAGVSPDYEEIKDAILEEYADDLHEEALETIDEKFKEGQLSWVLVKDEKLRNSIRNTILKLTNFVEILQYSNSLRQDEELLSPIVKEQLICVLKAAIIELEGPYVERNRLHGLFNWMTNLVKRTGTKVAEEHVYQGMRETLSGLGEIIEYVSDSSTTLL